MVKYKTLWGKHSGRRGWVVDCLKSVEIPKLYFYDSQGLKTKIYNEPMSWHVTKGHDGKNKPKTIFFPIERIGIYELINYPKDGGFKLVYDQSFHKYKTITPDEKDQAQELWLNDGFEAVCEMFEVNS